MAIFDLVDQGEHHGRQFFVSVVFLFITVVFTLFFFAFITVVLALFFFAFVPVVFAFFLFLVFGFRHLESFNQLLDFLEAFLQTDIAVLHFVDDVH